MIPNFRDVVRAEKDAWMNSGRRDLANLSDPGLVIRHLARTEIQERGAPPEKNRGLSIICRIG